MNQKLRDKAQAFLALHSGPRILVLPNAWDAVSARIFADAGFPAIATTSAGLASVFGYADGENISKTEMLHLAGRMAAVVDVPVTADLEAAYASTPEGAAETARDAMKAGLAGMNFEDSRKSGGQKHLVEIEFQTEMIRAIRQTASAAGIPFVINARTDSYLYGPQDPESRFRETVRRAAAYREAGADCIFPIGVRDAETIRQLAREMSGPINVLAGPGMPSAAELEQMGVARVTFGSGLMRGTFPLVRRIAEVLRDSGTWTSFTQTEFTNPRVNEMFT